jgi:hypothetical protein
VANREALSVPVDAVYAVSLRAAAVEIRDASWAYDDWSGEHPGDEPPEEISERLSRASRDFQTACGFGFAVDDLPVAELLIEILPAAASGAGPSVSDEARRYTAAQSLAEVRDLLDEHRSGPNPPAFTVLPIRYSVLEELVAAASGAGEGEELARRDLESLREVVVRFKTAHERFHPNHWVSAKFDAHCYACDFCAAYEFLEAKPQPNPPDPR